jgi:hypothetical protein
MVLCINLLKSIPKLATRRGLSLCLSISLCLRHGSLQGTQSWIWFFLLLIHLSFSCSFFNFFKNIMGVDHTNVTSTIVHRLWYYNLFDTTQNIWDLNYFFSHTSCIFQLKYFKIYIYIYICGIWWQFRPSSAYDSPYWTTNAGAPVYNNDSSLTVGSRGIYIYIYWL